MTRTMDDDRFAPEPPGFYIPSHWEIQVLRGGHWQPYGITTVATTVPQRWEGGNDARRLAEHYARTRLPDVPAAEKRVVKV